MAVQQTVLVGIDGSPAGWSALQWAAGEAELTGRRLLVVHAGDVDADGVVDDGDDLVILPAPSVHGPHATCSASLDKLVR